MRKIAWRIAGTFLFLVIGWALLTLSIMIPWFGDDWAAWAVSASILLKIVFGFGAAMSVILAWQWLINPPEEFQ